MKTPISYPLLKCPPEVTGYLLEYPNHDFQSRAFTFKFQPVCILQVAVPTIKRATDFSLKLCPVYVVPLYKANRVPPSEVSLLHTVHPKQERC